jgi:hypothetical protein
MIVAPIAIRARLLQASHLTTTTSFWSDISTSSFAAALRQRLTP